MRNSIAPAHEREVELSSSEASICAYLSDRDKASLWLDGRGGFEHGWSTGSLVAVRPTLSLTFPGPGLRHPDRALAAIEAILRRRRRRGGTNATGVALLLGYEALDRPQSSTEGKVDVPRIVAFEVDRSLRPLARGRYLLTESRGVAGSTAFLDRVDEAIFARNASTEPDPSVSAARVCGTVRRRLGVAEYLEAVRRVKHHIACGDVYQANLCQHFTAPYVGDPCRLFNRLSSAMPAPRSAYVRAQGFCLASFSPEIFLRGGPGGNVETWPIKGTRPRRADRLGDAAAARDLLSSPKDRAELLMIVDLERNDLGRVCRTGSVRVRELASLQSFATVHHLVACVQGRLRPDVGLRGLLRATFPGGSISGAPKIRARQILQEIERGPRGFFTGVLGWLADDGSFDSSILIRTLVFAQGRVHLGAGGGIVADSDPEQEWQESNLKARAPAAALGFTPEEAR